MVSGLHAGLGILQLREVEDPIDPGLDAPRGEMRHHLGRVDEAMGANEMITFFNIHGAMVYVDEQRQVKGYEDVYTKLDMCRRHDEANGLGGALVDQYVR